jgi:hypothetical protein
MSSNRPLVFVDLDDTLFQTARKMGNGERFPVSFNVEGKPSGYMSVVQKQFIEWMLDSADVVPVTARSVEAYIRVNLPFKRGAVCSYGGVILSPDKVVDEKWNAWMFKQLVDVQGHLDWLCAITLQIGEELGFSLRGWVVGEVGINHYIVIKHNEIDDAVLTAVLGELRKRNLLGKDLHAHCNGNNLALLPHALSKRGAVQEWIARDMEINGERPRLGFGDSISDLGFLGECHWWATPQRGQLAARLSEFTTND